jgi:hypothetical protein
MVRLPAQASTSLVSQAMHIWLLSFSIGAGAALMFTLFATLENKHLKLVWTGGATRLPPYCVLLSSVLAHAKDIREVLSDFTQHNIRTGSLDYGPYYSRLQEAGAALRKSLFDAADNLGAGEEAEEMLRSFSGRPELHIFSEVCVPWGFVANTASCSSTTLNDSIDDFSPFWSSQFLLTLRAGQAWHMEPEPRKRDGFRMLHALHKDRFNQARGLLSDGEREALNSFIDCDVGNVTTWSDCRERWKTIRDTDSILHIFGHSDGERIYLKDPDGDEENDGIANSSINLTYCLEADRFRTIFAKERSTRSVTICFLNGCRTGAGPVGESFLDVLFNKGFQGFIGTEAEVSNEFAARYATNFIDRLWMKGETIRAAYETLRTQLFPLSLVYSCYAHPDFQIEAGRRPT